MSGTFFPDTPAKPASIAAMLPETHPLIEKVTEPLADNAERRMAAHAFLGEKFDAAHPGVAEATARIEAAGRRKFPKLRKALPWVLAALAVGVVIASHASILSFVHSLYNTGLFEPWTKPALPAGLTEEQRLLLGDPKVADLEQKRRLHLHAPENPAYFAEYAQGFVSERSALPPDFLETATRIAPDNAYFLYFAAGRIGKESFTKKKLSGSSPPQRMVDGVRLRPLPREAEFDITDPAAFEEAMALIAKAAALPGFETYTNPMIAARVRLLPADTMAEFTRALMYAYGGSSGMIQLRYVADLLCARSEQLSKSGSKEELIALAEQREALIAHLGRNPDIPLIGELVHSVIAIATAKNFEAAADRLGLTEMAETYRKQGEAFQTERDMRDIRVEKEKDPFPEEKASSLHRLALPMINRQVNTPPPVTEADFEPMRRAEHELVGGLGILALALSLPLAALVVFLFRFTATPMIRVPAKRMVGVLCMADWAWVIGFGVVLPILCFLLVTRFTPLGGREYGVMFFQAAFPGVQFAALLLALLIVPAIVVRWRLGKILAPFGFGDRFTVPLALAVMAMIALWSLAALPVVEHLTKAKLLNHFTFAALAAPPVLCLCLLFANALRSILGKPAARLAQCATGIAVLPAYPIAILFLCALTPIYSAGEKRWLAKETLLRIDPDAPDLGAYEFKVAAQKRKEINAIMER
ncbi:MAG: hypothetical protein RLZZ505_910 [Verrucomicrobiota bacterium]|jgi:hypothetical protein